MHEEYKSRHDWVVKMIHWELCKKLKFGRAVKCYMHKPEFVFVNESDNIILDFEIQMCHLARKED